MKIELNLKNKQIIETDVIEDIKRISNQINKESFSFLEYQNSGGKYSDSPITRLFGSWNNLLLKCNLIPKNFVNYPDEILFQNLENVWRKLGRQPSRRDLTKENGSIMTYYPYVRRFKSWNGALVAFAEFVNYEIDSNDREMKLTSTNKTPRDINIRLRFKTLQRDDFKCCKCGRSPSTNPGLILHVDHIIPYSKGGQTILENLQTLCQDCNLGKSNLN